WAEWSSIFCQWWNRRRRDLPHRADRRADRRALPTRLGKRWRQLPLLVPLSLHGLTEDAPVKDLTLTFSGSTQRLSDALVDRAPGGKDDVPFRALHLQPDGANANAVFLGGSASLTSSLYGVRLPASSSGVPSAPYVFEFSAEGPLKLSHFYVLGT